MDTDKILRLNCKQLRLELKTVGLSHGGTKPELQKRLKDHFENQRLNKHVSPATTHENGDIHSEQRAKLEALELEIEILKRQRELDNLKLADHKNPVLDSSDIKTAMVEAVYASHVKVVEPAVFNGNPLEFNIWKVDFESLMKSSQIESSDRFSVLTRYLSGKALDVIRHLSYVKDDSRFDRALALLEKRFGDSYTITEAFRSKLENWPDIKPQDNDALFELSDFVQQCLQVKNYVSGLSILDDGRENQKLLRHMPAWFLTKWREKIVEFKATNQAQYPPFEFFADFLAKQAEIVSEPITRALFTESYKHRAVHVAKEKPQPLLSTQHIHQNVSQLTASRSSRCSCCDSAEHKLAACSKFQERPWAEKHTFVKTKRLCFACLGFGHAAKDCRNRHTCKLCKKQHPTCLHRETTPNTDSTTTTIVPTPDAHVSHAVSVDTHRVQTDTSPRVEDSAKMLEVDDEKNFFTTIVPVWLSSAKNPAQEILVYAMLDSMSSKSFVLTDIHDQLECDSFDTTLKLGTMASRCTSIDTRCCYDLQIRSHDKQCSIKLPPTYTRSFIPADVSSIPNPVSVATWPHLSHIASQIPPRLDCPVALLLSYKCVRAFLPRECITGKDNEPFARRTDLGWLIMGPESNYQVDCDDIGMTHCLLTLPVYDSGNIVETEPKHTVKFQCSTAVNESFSQRIIRALESDFNDNPSEKTLSQNDGKFLDIMKSGIYQDQITKHYSMPLPFKESYHDLPSNRNAVLNRLDLLRHKLMKDADYRAQYFQFINGMIERGEAEPVPTGSTPQSAWYIPHFAVKHAKKKKLRVVFDCSAKHKGISLNDCLLRGPDHINSLVGILMRFRLNNVAITCDIEKMFYQFAVHEGHRDYLRFLWFSDESMTDVVELRMTVHLFGATSSPACTTFGLRTLANEHHNPDNSSSVRACQFINQDFYVDDGICSVPCVQSACELANYARDICKEGGVRLHKFLSNSVEVMRSIPQSEHADSVQALDFNTNINDSLLPVERTLGISWSVKEDSFQFSVETRHNKLTRRTLLSTVASVYDPLGWLAPFVLKGKRILQSVCRLKLSWDDDLPNELRVLWEAWLAELPRIRQLRIPRQYWPTINPYLDLKVVEVHHFGDASTSGYGQCSYLRMVSHTNEVKCAFIMGKARVTPSKPVTIPRLELQAAVISVRTAQQILEELNLQGSKHIFWTDSTAVLGYITNDDKQYNTFVANRVQTIRSYTKPSQWHYVKSRDNPADIASRTCDVSELSGIWLTGPKFLYDPDLDANQCLPPRVAVAPHDPEVKCMVNAITTVDKRQTPRLYEHLQGISTWNRMLGVVKVFKTKAWSIKGPSPIDPVMSKQLCAQYIIKELQQDTFASEIAIIESKGSRKLPKSSPLYKLDPFLDEAGILRVGGRCSRARWEFSDKHPMILPRKSHITDVIIRHHHHNSAHQGRYITANAMREAGFWVIGLSRAVAKVIHYCVICRKERGAFSKQKMADLPVDRLDLSPPFTFVGCDCFGPFLVKENRKELKRYGILFTCLYCRGVHIEVLDDMTTDSFINSFRCFKAIRGHVRKLYCDRGSNFVGASSAFNQASKSMLDSDMADKLSGLDCEFVFNPPHASHMGGIWERQIRTIRSVLTNLINRHPCRLNTTELRTLFFETMNIVNSRPLAVENLFDPQGPQPLTPNHLLTMKSQVVVAPAGEFSDADLYVRQRWKKIQFLANVFWKDWKRQYLSNAQSRPKWSNSESNVKVDCIAIISDENSPRNLWRLGRVVEVFESEDKLVRKVRLFTGVVSGRAQYVERPVHRLVVLLD